MSKHIIKFRGQPIEDYGDINWFYGSAILDYEEELAYIDAPGQGIVPVVWESVGQYTGKNDTEGTEIYDEDCLYAPGNLTDELQYVGVVVWDKEDARWEVKNMHGRYEWIPDGCVVRGSLHDVLKGDSKDE